MSQTLSAATTQLEHLRRLLADRYVVEQEVGRGASSFVYLARDRSRNESVALKVLRPELLESGGATRFLREVEIIRRLDHPRILPLLDSGAVEQQLYYTMPFVDGLTLRAALLRERLLPIDRALSITRDVAEALEYAHSRGVVHRDIKPANILVDSDGRAVVADFGIARAMIVASGERITSTGLAIGTPEYMSPEQGDPARELDGRADIYSLGCVLHEMLGGEPPFGGPSAQAIIARHCHEAPRSLRVIRPSIPIGVERAMMKMLAKVPVDRYGTGAELIEALDAIDLNESDDAPRRRWPIVGRMTFASALVIAGLLAGWRAIQRTHTPLDQRRIVVFPLRDAAGDSAGEGVATYIGYALDGTRPLKWLEAVDVMDDRSRADPSRIAPADARRIGARAGAAYYIDGSILRRPDSLTVVLRLHAINGDSIIHTSGATGPATAYLPHLGLQAMADLLPAILPPGRAIDLLSLSERNPAAIANFLQGEREYRRTQFDAALDHYATAVRDDSAFALAAFRGAQAATWLSRADTSLLNVALRGARYLTPTQALLAKALDGYLKGDADSAVTHLRSALLADSTLSAAWTLLGEVYARALTSEPAADSLARASLHRAERLDPDFAPTLVLLEEMALQDGDLREAKRLGTALQRAGAATTHATERDLMSRCVSDGVTTVNWSDAARRDGDAVLSAGRVLSRRLAQPACARAAFTTALESDSAKRGQRWGALMGLHGVLVATGRPREFDSLVASPAARGLPAWSLYLAAAGAGAGFEREASLASDSLWSQLGQLPSPTLWLLGAWAAHRSDTTGLRRAAAALRAIADTAPSRRNLLLARLVEARLPLIAHDTDGAIARLRTLKPSAPRREIAWQHAEGLGAERLLLAELLLARHRYAESIQVASLLDATEPVPYLLYLRSSLTTRVRAAAAMNSGALVRQFERRLRALDDASSTSRR